MPGRRRQFREIEVIETLLIQGVIIPCYRCKIPFTLEDVRARNIEKEHLHEVILDGPDMPDNCRFSHAAAPCHHTVTNGTKATSAGSSKHKAAKIRSGHTDKFVVNKPPIGTERHERPTKPWASRKIQARANPWPPKGFRQFQKWKKR